MAKSREDATLAQYLRALISSPLASRAGAYSGKKPLTAGISFGDENRVSAGKLPLQAQVELQGNPVSAGKAPLQAQIELQGSPVSASKSPLQAQVELQGNPVSAGKIAIQEIDMSDWRIPNIKRTVKVDESEDLSAYLRASNGLPSAGKIPLKENVNINGGNVSAGKRPLQESVSIDKFPASAGKMPINGRSLGNEQDVAAIKAIGDATQAGTQIDFVQNNLNGGEISPEMLGRIDQPHYHNGCEELVNLVPLPQGGISKRPGMEYLGATTESVKLIPFVVSASESLVLELRAAGEGDGAYLFAWKGNERIPTGLTLPYTRAALKTLQYAQSADVMFFASETYPPAKLMHYSDNEWRFEQISWKPTIEKPTGIRLQAGGDEQSGAQQVWYDYVVTAIDENGEEGEPSVWTESNHIKTNKLSSSWSITISWTPVAGAVAYRVYKKDSGVFGYIGRVEGVWDPDEVAAQQAAQQEAQESSQSDIEQKKQAYEELSTSLENARNRAVNLQDQYRDTCITNIYNEDGTTLTHTSTSPECEELYQRYVNAANEAREIETQYEQAKAAYESAVNGSSGSSSTPSEIIGPYFLDQNIAADTEDTPPKYDEPFATEYPRIVFLHQQRLGWAATKHKPLTIWLSSTGMYERMAYSLPPKDDDRIEVTLAATQINRILWCMSDRDGLAIGTEGGEWLLRAGENRALTPSDLSFQPQTAHGSHECSTPVIRAGGSLLFLQRGGRVIRTFGYAFEADRYKANDVTLLARHIFRNASLVSWAWQAEPHSIVWCVLSDGTMAGFTYLEDQQVWAWHRHVTNGKILAVASIPTSTGEDALYLAVKRGDKFHVEKLRSFYADNAESENQYTDGAAKDEYVGYCIPTLPEQNLRNGSSFLHIRKINAVKCRVIRSVPFHVQVGDSEPLPIPVRSNPAGSWASLAAQYTVQHCDWAVPLESGWRENDRLRLIFDNKGPATVLGIVTTVEVADFSGSKA